MRVREKKGGLKSLITRENFLKMDKAQLIRLLIIAGAVVAAIIVIVNLVARGNIESSFLSQRETVRVGIRTDITAFGQVDEEGEVTGFDADVAREVVGRVLETDKPVSFVPIGSEDAGASIKYGQTDIAIGLLVPDTARVAGFSITDPYYMDNIYAAVAGPSITSLSALDGKTVGILNSMIPLATANGYLDRLGITADIVRYYGLEEASADLEAGVIDAFFAPGAVLSQYMPSFSRIEEPVAQIGYGILLPTGESVVRGAMNDAIRAMKQDGTIEDLARKWGIEPQG